MFWRRISYPVNPDNPTDIRPPHVPRFVTKPDVSSDLPPPNQLKDRPLGRVLVKMRKVSREQVIEALAYQKKLGGLMGEVMVKLGFVQPADVHAALAAQRGESP